MFRKLQDLRPGVLDDDALLLVGAHKGQKGAQQAEAAAEKQGPRVGGGRGEDVAAPRLAAQKKGQAVESGEVCGGHLAPSHAGFEAGQ
jgi:hypothetical protein